MFLFAVNDLVHCLSFPSHCKIKSLCCLHFVSEAGVTIVPFSKCRFLSAAQVICIASYQDIPLTDLFCQWPMPSQGASAVSHL